MHSGFVKTILFVQHEQCQSQMQRYRVTPCSNYKTVTPEQMFQSGEGLYAQETEGEKEKKCLTLVGFLYEGIRRPAFVKGLLMTETKYIKVSKTIDI